LSARMTIKKLIGQRKLEWPKGWIDDLPILKTIQRPILNEHVRDKVVWKRENGKLCKFSVKQAYDDLLEVIEDVECTQDKIKKWGSYDVMRCPLCKNDTDSHTHLLFECEFSKAIWAKVIRKIGVDWKETNWSNNVEAFAIRWNGNSINSIIIRISLAASVYMIWQERNNRIFRDEMRNPDEIYKILEDIIRIRLLSLKVKNSVAVKKAQEIWNVKMNIIDSSDLQLIAPCILESTGCDCTH
ncbi:reverse transcriptase zinc-binding domain-containing protein, partial [Tanacetum coccineum]